MTNKKKANKQKSNIASITSSNNLSLPFVSICTPTFNRRPFINSMIQCFNHQTYPKDKMEWIIIDDGTDKIEDLVKHIPQVKYFKYDFKMSLGKKRNLMHEKSKGSILVYMDDDDYYPPERVSHAVDTLLKNPSALCAGSSEIYIWFKHIQKMWKFGPYGPNHATAGTFAFKRELLNQTHYNDEAALAEEKAFLKNYTIPFAQLNPMKTILCFSHEHNTFDKRKLLEMPPSEVSNASNLTVDDFIKDKNLKDFFMNQIEGLLEKYEPGKPEMKPDVMKQLVEIEEKRKIEMQKMQNQGSICIQQPGKEPVPLSNNEIIQLLQNNSAEINKLQKQIQMNETFIKLLKDKIIEKDNIINQLKELLTNNNKDQEEQNILLNVKEILNNKENAENNNDNDNEERLLKEINEFN
jgi:hypothetical protein